MSAYSGPEISNDGLIMMLDAANPKSFSPNVFAKPLDIYTWYVTQRGNSGAAASTISQDNATVGSPAGGIPLRMDVTGNDPHIGSYNTPAWNICPVSNGQTWRVSVYAKASTTLNNCEIYIFGADSTGVSFVGGSYIGITAKTITITPEWQRFDHFITFNNASVAYIQMRLDGPNSGGAGTTVWWDGLQVELAPVMTAFNQRTNTNRASWSDISGNNITGTLTNYPAFTTANNGAFTFDGVNQIVDCGNPTAVNFGDGDFTVGAWFYRDTNATTNLRLLSKGSGSDTASEAGFAFFGGNTSISFTVNPSGTRTFAAASITTGTPTYITGVVERGGLQSIYKNGVFVASTAAPTGSVTGAAALCIGCNTSAAGGRNVFWDGGVYNVSLYNRALTAAEVAQNFNALRGRYGV